LIETETKRLKEDTEKKAADAKIPLKQYIEIHLGYKDQSAYEKIVIESAEKNLRLILAIEKIIDELKIEVTDDDLNQHLEKMGKAYGTTAEDIKQRLNNRFDGVKTFIIQEKVFAKLASLNK
jgi:FKBP-type peptidyl-prolyl cis-trans isomerase (trigger factor)